jgi:predicted ATPase/class 3 adenylate cyclase
VGCAWRDYRHVGGLPVGTVTFLFTDVEGSTALLLELGADAYAEELGRHRRVLRAAVDEHGGVEVDTQGDAFFVAFTSAREAVLAARQAQDALSDGPIRVRMGLHTGEALLTDEGYVGVDVHRAARIAAAGNGGQVLVSASTAALTDGAGLHDLGEHRFKDLAAAERVYQLGEGVFPPLKSLYRTNLPVPATPFLGRREELARIVELVRNDGVRLLTLSGPGGTGKTRLALQAAAETAEAFPDGTTWVSLAPLRDASLVPLAVAQALGVREQPGFAPVDRVVNALQGKSALLLLDNAEHLLPPVAEVIARLAGADGTTVLVTSRERLRVQSEQVWPVPELSASDAVELFLAQARRIDAGYQPSPAVGELCARLDHLPLAVELAAARTAVFSPEQLLERIGERLDLLEGPRDADPRQHTLRTTIKWSHELLDEEERALFRTLSVFAGGCTFEAAEQVCGATPDTLQSLLDKSLLRHRADAPGRRYFMLETIREYAAERLARSGAETDVRTSHATYFCALAERASLDEPSRQDQVFWLDRLDAEHDNLRSALDYVVSRGLADVELRLVMSLRSFWYLRGYWTEGRARVEHALALPVAERPEVRTGLLNEAAQLAERQGDFALARALTSQHLTLGRELGDERKLAEALMRAGIASVVRDDLQAAQTHFREVLLLSRQIDDNWFAARARLNLGFCFVAAEDLVQAEREFERGVDLARAVANKGLLAACLCGLSLAHLTSGRADQALPWLKEALLLSVEIRSPEHIAAALESLSRALATSGQPEDGARLLGAALSALKELSSVDVLPVFGAFRELTEAILCQRLGAERFKAALNEGAQLGILPGAEYALRIVG